MLSNDTKIQNKSTAEAKGPKLGNVGGNTEQRKHTTWMMRQGTDGDSHNTNTPDNVGNEDNNLMKTQTQDTEKQVLAK